MNWARCLAVFLILIALTFSQNSTSFAQSKSAQMCNSANVQAVYVCIGNVVRVVSSVPGAGSTFYKPDGEVVQCPVATPTQIGASCVQLLMPNFCPAQGVCGNSSTQIFPGTNGSAEQTGNSTYYIVPGQGASSNNSTVSTPNVTMPVKQEIPAPMTPNNVTITPMNSGNGLDNITSYLAYVIFFLGVVAVVLLFMMFRKSLSEE